MVRWNEFEGKAAEIATAGRALIYQFGSGSGYLATVGADGMPVIQRVDPVVHQAGLCVYLPLGGGCAERLASDPRYAFHTEGPEATDDEFYVTGVAAQAGEELRTAVMEAREPDPRTMTAEDVPFELGIERAMLATYRPRAEGNSWPPTYSRWSTGLPASGGPSHGESPAFAPAAGWQNFERGAPEMAATVRAQLYCVGIGLGFLATVRADGGPRMHPFCPIFSGERLYGLILDASPKCRDLLRDSRVAIHGFQFPESPRAVLLQGRAVHSDEAALVAQVEQSFRDVGGVSADHALFEFRLERVAVTEYPAGVAQQAEWNFDGSLTGAR